MLPIEGCDATTWDAYRRLIELREGVVLHVYRDSLGLPTAGVGHLITDDDGPLTVGQHISVEQSIAWFERDGAAAMRKAVELAGLAHIKSQAFLPYLASVCFQLGLDWTHKFPQTWHLILNGQYERAVVALNATAWRHQTPVRVADFQRALRALPPLQLPT